MEDQIFERYVDFATRLRMGEAFNRIEFDEFLRDFSLIVAHCNYIPKKIGVVMINFTHDLEAKMAYSSSEEKLEIENAIYDYLEFIYKLLSD